MASVSTLKKIVEACDSPPQSSSENLLLEVFCVDTSISMARSQSFPYIFGESKLSVCRRIIFEGFALPENCILHTALVTFHASPRLAVPFAVHTPEQVELIKAALTNVEHHKGSSIFSSYAFCEKLISDYQHEHRLQRSKVLIHLFTDGIDNGSLPEDVEKYQMAAANSESHEGLRQSFLYSFDHNFEQSSTLAKSLQAHLVVIHESELNTALEDRDKWVLKFLDHKPKISKAHQGFNLAKGYTPDLASVYKVLQKAYRFFSSGKAATKEGLFRVNANVNESKRLASQLLAGNDHLSDFEDSHLVAHALKTALGNSPPILPPSFQHTLLEFAPIKFPTPESRLAAAKAKIEDLPHINKECFHILLFLLQIVAKESSVNKMTSANLASIFTYLLFPELLVPKPSLQDLIVLMIDNCQSIFPGQPKLKTITGTATDFVDPTAPRPSSPVSMIADDQREHHVPLMIPLPGTAAFASSSGTPSAVLSSSVPTHLPASSAPADDEEKQDSMPRVKIDGSLKAREHEDLQNPASETSASNLRGPSASSNPTTSHLSPRDPLPSMPFAPSVPTHSTSSTLERPLPPHLRKLSVGSTTHTAAQYESESSAASKSSPTAVQQESPWSSQGNNANTTDAAAASTSEASTSLVPAAASTSDSSSTSTTPTRTASSSLQPTSSGFLARPLHAQPPTQPPPAAPSRSDSESLVRASSATSLASRPSNPPPPVPLSHN